MTGSGSADRVIARLYLEGSTGYVTFATEGESAQFDTSWTADSEGCSYATRRSNARCRRCSTRS